MKPCNPTNGEHPICTAPGAPVMCACVRAEFDLLQAPAEQAEAPVVSRDLPPPPDLNGYTMRALHCGQKYGYIRVKSGQAIVRCDVCDGYVYTAPRSEVHG